MGEPEDVCANGAAGGGASPLPMPWQTGVDRTRSVLILSMPDCEACTALIEDVARLDLDPFDATLTVLDATNPADLRAFVRLRPTGFPAVYLFVGAELVGGWIGYSRLPNGSPPLDELKDYLSQKLCDDQNPERQA